MRGAWDRPAQLRAPARASCRSCLVKSCLLRRSEAEVTGPFGTDPQAVAEVKETSVLPMLTVDMENKENGSLDVKNSVENGRPPDPADWAVIDVVNYFRTAGFEEQANAFQEQHICELSKNCELENAALSSVKNFPHLLLHDKIPLTFIKYLNLSAPGLPSQQYCSNYY
ncbi:sterile alpha motif domain-containing protein 13 isoform X2 [Struthio camelus]|uniref:sterile alpha motif domain-containing protein 13 isoform X2 n=1 Tax=Struthio camelus TaxID=8801 RepID=UPI003603BC7B